MELKGITSKIKTLLTKYKYVAIVLLAGIGMMMLPDFDKKETITVEKIETKEEMPLETVLSNALSKVHGAGRVEVLLNVAQGPKTIYQMDEDSSGSENGQSDKAQTVTLTDSQRNEYGLVQQVNPPVYMGAIVLCQGADDPVVKLSIVEAVSKITGLNANQICVLKMH